MKNNLAVKTTQTQARRAHRMSRPLAYVQVGRTYKLWQLPEGMAILYRHVQEDRLYRFINRARQEDIKNRNVDVIHHLWDDVTVLDLGFRSPAIYGHRFN